MHPSEEHILLLRFEARHMLSLQETGSKAIAAMITEQI